MLLAARIPVDSADGASVVKMAGTYKVWTWDGTYHNLWAEVHESTDLYERITFSLENVVRALNGADRAMALPEDDEVRQARMRAAGHGPPVIDPSDLDALPPEERDDYEPIEWADKQNEADYKTLAEISDQLEAVTDGGLDTGPGLTYADVLLIAYPAVRGEQTRLLADHYDTLMSSCNYVITRYLKVDADTPSPERAFSIFLRLTWS